jgi:serine/threonine protein kinase
VVFAVPAGVELVYELGAGGVFSVALVRQADRMLIGKRLRSGLIDHPVARAAMTREVGLLSLLALPCVPELLAHTHDAGGAFWLQTCAAGESLTTRLSLARGPLPATEVAALTRGAFTALAALHDAKVGARPLSASHGDLNPDHVFVSDGEVSFIDFGQARWRDLDRQWLNEAERGTLPFVAPEVARGEAAPDAANDVFALAATIAFAALGREPCRETTTAGRLIEIAERGCDLDAIATAALTDGSRRALLSALQFDRAARVTTAAGVLALL